MSSHPRRSVAFVIAGISLTGLLFADWSCSQGPQILGSKCAADTDCISKSCVSGVCTRTCTNQGDCPVDFDCRETQNGTPVNLDTFSGTGTLLCLKATYPIPDAGSFGTNCTAVAAGCSDAGSPCASGFACHATNNAACDPTAYCTVGGDSADAGCSTDIDCPPGYLCGGEAWRYIDGGVGQFHGCIKRQRCDACETDDECPSGFICAHDNIGGRFCGQPCQITDNCLKPYTTTGSSGNEVQYGSFETCQADPVTGTKVCTPGTGACHGKSALSDITGDGQICSPCRPGVAGDCAMGLGCIQEFEGERFCTTGCQMTLTFHTDSMGNITYSQSQDMCPDNTFCFYGGSAAIGDLCAVPLPDGGFELQSPCTVNGDCNADPDYEADTCYPNQ